MSNEERREEVKIVFYDMETNGLNKNKDQKQEGVEICSIAAYYPTGRKLTNYKGYIIPTKPIEFQASQINGFTLNDDDLYHHGNVVKDALPAKDGLEAFIKFLKENVVNDGDAKIKIVLVSTIFFVCVKCESPDNHFFLCGEMRRFLPQTKNTYRIYKYNWLFEITLTNQKSFRFSNSTLFQFSEPNRNTYFRTTKLFKPNKT